MIVCLAGSLFLSLFLSLSHSLSLLALFLSPFLSTLFLSLPLTLSFSLALSLSFSLALSLSACAFDFFKFLSWQFLYAISSWCVYHIRAFYLVAIIHYYSRILTCLTLRLHPFGFFIRPSIQPNSIGFIFPLSLYSSLVPLKNVLIQPHPNLFVPSHSPSAPIKWPRPHFLLTHVL